MVRGQQFFFFLADAVRSALRHTRTGKTLGLALGLPQASVSRSSGRSKQRQMYSPYSSAPVNLGGDEVNQSPGFRKTRMRGRGQVAGKTRTREKSHIQERARMKMAHIRSLHRFVAAPRHMSQPFSRSMTSHASIHESLAGVNLAFVNDGVMWQSCDVSR